MSKKWKQVDGDVTWEKYGATFAREDGRGVDIWKFDTWANMDSSAIPTHGLYCYDEGYFDFDDLGEGILPGELPKRAKEACQYTGMDEAEYARLEPIYKAAVMASLGGLDSSTSTSNLLEALPDDPEKIEFNGGHETTEKVKEYNRDERRDALRDHFDDARQSAGEWPDDDTLDFAFGDETDFDMKLGQTDGEAFDYAMVMANIKKYSSPHVTIDKNDFKKVVTALWECPGGEGMSKSQLAKAANCLDMEGEDDEAIAERTAELYEEAQSLASSMMESIGIEWV